MDQPTRATIVPFIADILTRRGADSYLGEAVTMQQHMLQCAHLAELEGASDELVAAALLHDIGHYLGEFGEDYIAQGVDDLHEEAGAKVLAGFFPPLLVECVRLHVAAKRYLCATDPGYFARLSPRWPRSRCRAGRWRPMRWRTSSATRSSARRSGCGCGTRRARRRMR